MRRLAPTLAIPGRPYMCEFDANEFREWVQLLFVVIGGTIALIAFFQGNRQRKLDNAIKIVEKFMSELEPASLDSWEYLFVKASELSGAKPGQYISDLHGSRSISEFYFSNAPIDHGALEKMADSIEIICHHMLNGTVDKNYVWFEIGQLIEWLHYWLSCSEGNIQGESLLDMAYPNMKRIYKKEGKRFRSLPSRSFMKID